MNQTMHEPRASSTPRVPLSERIVSLDQFRGYTVLGMFVVNFVGFFAVVPAALKHHNTYCSYADTIMPQFFFAVGLAYRLTFLRRARRMDRPGLYERFIRRSLGLIGLGALLYLSGAALEAWMNPPSSSWPSLVVRGLRTDVFQALVHIGVTVLWILPVIGAGPLARVAFAGGSAAIQVVLSHAFYYQWVMTAPGIDGGPLGFLTWSIPMLAGSLAYDAVAAGSAGAAVQKLAAWGLALMIAGYALSCLNRVTPPNSYSGGGLREVLLEPPLVPPTRAVNYWTMNQQAGTVPYLIFGSGLSLALYAVFVWACDIRGFQFAVLRTLGVNALAGYVIHMVVDQAMKPLLAHDAAWAVALTALAGFLAVCYLSLRFMEKKGIYLRL